MPDLRRELYAMQGPMKLMHDGYMRHGEVFTVPVLHKQFTFLLGPHVSGHFFKANDDEMSQKEVNIQHMRQACWLSSLVHSLRMPWANVQLLHLGRAQPRPNVM